MSLNKYSSPEEVKEHYNRVTPIEAMEAWIMAFYPMQPIKIGQLSLFTLEQLVRTLSTKSMETL